MKFEIWKREPNLGPLVHDFCNGKVAIVTSRCPSKTTDNEDGALLVEFEQHHGILAVTDGMGGHAAGARASETVLETLLETLTTRKSPDTSLRAAIVDSLELANQRILDWSLGAGTTVVVAELIADQIRFIHVGDSCGFLCSNRGRIKYQTVAHAPVAQAVELGMLDPHEAIDHEDRHLINNYIGYAKMRIEVGPEINMARRDTVALATDGLLDNLTIDEAAHFLKTRPIRKQMHALAQQVAHRMIETEGHSGKPDDCTMVSYQRN